MEIKFKIGQGVWFMNSNKPFEALITKIEITQNARGKINIVYTMDAKISRLEENIANSKEDLRKIIFKQ